MQSYKEQLAFFPTIVDQYQQNYIVTSFSEKCTTLQIRMSCMMENILYLLRTSLYRVYMELFREQLAFFPTMVQKYQQIT